MIFTKSAMQHPDLSAIFAYRRTKQIFLYESSNYDHLLETKVEIRGAKWFLYIIMALYPSISIATWLKGGGVKALVSGQLKINCFCGFPYNLERMQFFVTFFQ